MIYLPADRTANLVIWVVVWTLIVVWVVITGLSTRLPSVVELVRFLQQAWLVRWALLAFWVWLGWHLLIRTTA